jgi:hypothetical protein
MIVTIIQGLSKEGNKKNIIVKVFVAMWRFENLYCILSPQAYLH